MLSRRGFLNDGSIRADYAIRPPNNKIPPRVIIFINLAARYITSCIKRLMRVLLSSAPQDAPTNNLCWRGVLFIFVAAAHCAGYIFAVYKSHTKRARL
jgi:hypothetical protein